MKKNGIEVVLQAFSILCKARHGLLLLLLLLGTAWTFPFNKAGKGTEIRTHAVAFTSGFQTL